MADLGEDFELFEIFPRSPDTEIWYDARDAQAAPDDTQQSNDNVSDTSTTPDPDPVISEDSARSASAISHLWQRAVVSGKNTTMADIVTFFGFPLLILGAWTAFQAIRMAQWTQWKDSFEWCENHNWTYPGCASLRDSHLIIPSGSRAMKRFVTGTRIECFNDTLPTGPGMPAMSILGSALYLLVVILFDLVRRFSKNRKASESDESGATYNWEVYRASMYRFFQLRQSLSSSILEIDKMCWSLEAGMNFSICYQGNSSMLFRLVSLKQELETLQGQVSRVLEGHYIMEGVWVIDEWIAAHRPEWISRLTILQSELKKHFAEVFTQIGEFKEVALSYLKNAQPIGISTPFGTDTPRTTQRDWRNGLGAHNEGIRKRLPDI